MKVGGVEKVYELTFVPDPSSDATLRSIAVNGNQISGFKADSLNYNVPMPDDGKMPLIT